MTEMHAVQFYSWYIYHKDEEDMGKPVSSAAYVDDVNSVRSSAGIVTI